MILIVALEQIKRILSERIFVNVSQDKIYVGNVN